MVYDQKKLWTLNFSTVWKYEIFQRKLFIKLKRFRVFEIFLDNWTWSWKRVSNFFHDKSLFLILISIKIILILFSEKIISRVLEIHFLKIYYHYDSWSCVNKVKANTYTASSCRLIIIQLHWWMWKHLLFLIHLGHIMISQK